MAILYREFLVIIILSSTPTMKDRCGFNKYHLADLEDRTKELESHAQFLMDSQLGSWFLHSLPYEHDPSDISQIPG